jgi:hypothetical protein
MARIFKIMAALDTLLLLASYALGIASKLLHGVEHAESPIFWYHWLLGLATAVVTLFVHCLIFTYFLGTGRWVKEVKLAYRLPDEPLPKLTRDLKRRVFPPALFSMLAAIATGAAGAAAQVRVAPWELHFALATLTLLVNLWAFRIEIRCLQTNVRVLDEVLVEVDRLRTVHGLVSNAEALEQESQR